MIVRENTSDGGVMYRTTDKGRRFLKIIRDAEERVRWTVTLLEKAVRRLAERLGGSIVDSWNGANYLHIWGFHQAKVDAEAVKIRMPAIESLIEMTKKTLTSSEHTP